MRSSITKNQSEKGKKQNKKKKKNEKKRKSFAICCERNTPKLVSINHPPTHHLFTHSILVKQLSKVGKIVKLSLTNCHCGEKQQNLFKTNNRYRC